jgi:hypothetical protein
MKRLENTERVTTYYYPFAHRYVTDIHTETVSQSEIDEARRNTPMRFISFAEVEYLSEVVKSSGEMTPFIERFVIIARRRFKGDTFREIGEREHCCADRARQLFIRGWTRLEHAAHWQLRIMESLTK